MPSATADTTTVLLTLLTIVTTLQFVLLIVITLRMHASITRLRVAIAPLLQGDATSLRDRAEQLLEDVETLVTRANRMLLAVERGATGLGTAAMVASATARRAITGGSLEARAAATGIGAGVRWLLGLRARRAAARAAS